MTLISNKTIIFVNKLLLTWVFSANIITKLLFVINWEVDKEIEFCT